MVDFNSLSEAQASAASEGAGRYDTLAGNDVIALPNHDVVVPGGYNASHWFLGGEGNDTIRGGTRRDKIDGGPGNDTLVGSPAFDELKGNTGNDTFNFTAKGFAGFAGGTVQELDGGGQNATSGVNKGLDVIRLPGSPGDYQIAVKFLGDGWFGTHTEIKYAQPWAASSYTFDTNDIEKAFFAGPIENIVKTNAGDAGKPLAASGIAIEMLRLADVVYGPQPTLEHKNEKLAYEGGAQHNANVAKGPEGRGWHGVEAIELGIKPADFNEHGTLKYSFVDGFYAAYDPAKQGPIGLLLNDVAEANVLVLTGVVNGKRTLAISFRGTDQFADFDDYLDFNQHFAKFKPLIDALKTYIPEAGIEQVLVSGHSLGDGMAQTFLSKFPNTGQTKFIAVTDRSPGSDVGKSDARMMNFIHTDDAVTYAPLLTSAEGKFVIGLLAKALGKLVPTVGTAVELEVRKILADLKPKDRAGSDIEIDSSVTNGLLPGLAEHNHLLYTRDLIKLVSFATDEDSPFWGTRLAQKLRTGESSTLGRPTRSGSASRSTLMTSSRSTHSSFVPRFATMTSCLETMDRTTSSN